MNGKVVLFIRSLEIGGAERQLVLLAKSLMAQGTDVQVLTFYPGGALRAELETAGIPVADLGKRGRWEAVGFFLRLVRALRAARPRVLYSFLPVANILAVCASPFLIGMRVFWGVRASDLDLGRYDPLAKWVARIEAVLAMYAHGIIANSQAGFSHHVRRGFPLQRFHVIENGIDTERFRFDAQGRASLRRELGLTEEEILVGVVARLDPMKGLETFIEAAALAGHENASLRFVCVGDGKVEYAKTLRQQAHAAGLEHRLQWAGARSDMPKVYSAFDIATSPSSFGEGFSNAIAEAMACGRMCVVTDVGDSARIVGDAGIIVPPADPPALARALLELAVRSGVEREALGAQARTRVVSEFCVARMVDRTREVLTR